MLRSLQSGSVGRRLVAASLTMSLAAAFAAGCDSEFITDGETVVDILLDVPHALTVGQQAQASAQLIGSNGRIIPSSRMRATFTSRNVGVATVESTSGRLVGVSAGKAAIVAESRGITVIDTVEVVAR